MSSPPQIEANRRNSQKSTGPRSDAGKAVSSLNHTTSGIYAESQLLIGEDQAGLQALALEFYADFQPENAGTLLRGSGARLRCTVDFEGERGPLVPPLGRSRLASAGLV